MSRLAFVVCLLLVAARPPPYGGDIINYVYGGPVDADPAEARTAADAAAHSAVYEGLYTVRDGVLIPVLARDRPTVAADDITIPIRQGVWLHDGRQLTPRRAIEALTRLADTRAGAYVVAPILRRRGRLAIQPDDETHSIRIRLRFPFADFPFLLATDHARLAWSQPSGPMVGTGPFRWTSTFEQRPFLAYRDGRPFTDRLVWKPYASRFGAGALAQRGRAAVFGGPEVPRPLPGAGTWLVLQVGPTAGRSSQRDLIRAHVHTALQRKRLVRRYLPPHAKPAEGFIKDLLSEPKRRVEQSRPLELLAPRGVRFRHQLLDRLKLELFRTGLKVEILWLEPKVFSRRSNARQFDLRMVEVRPGYPDDGSPRAAWLRLLSVAAQLGSPVSSDQMRQYAKADAAGQKKILATIERDVRASSGAVVVGRLKPAVALPKAWPSTSDGSVDWANLVAEASP